MCLIVDKAFEKDFLPFAGTGRSLSLTNYLPRTGQWGYIASVSRYFSLRVKGSIGLCPLSRSSGPQLAIASNLVSESGDLTRNTSQKRQKEMLTVPSSSSCSIQSDTTVSCVVCVNIATDQQGGCRLFLSRGAHRNWFPVHFTWGGRGDPPPADGCISISGSFFPSHYFQKVTTSSGYCLLYFWLVYDQKAIDFPQFGLIRLGGS